MEHFLQGNVPLSHLLNAKAQFKSWWRSVFNEVNDWGSTSFASQMGIEFIETSAKENINVNQLFEMLTNSMLDLRQAKIEENFGIMSRTRVILEHSTSLRPRRSCKNC